MESHIDPDFRKCYLALPKEVRRTALADYLLWQADPFSNSLHFKEINKKESVWSVRAGIGYRVFDSIHEWGGWKLWASEELRQMPLKAQLDHWLRVLVERSAEIKQFKENGLEIILDCTLATRVYCLYLPAELQAQLAELGVDLEVTVYSRLRRMTRRQERNILRHR